jgi:CDP-diacylglycerol--glycerol-3-phosphate 3-phosphatidyltransferase
MNGKGPGVAFEQDRAGGDGIHSSRWFTLPNGLSLLRLLLTPVVVWLILTATPEALWTALVLMILAEVTDFLDGFLARALNQQSELGRMMDPVSDVIYHVSVFMTFLKQGWIEPWMLFVIYARDLGVPYLRTLARQRGVDLVVRFSGKVKTAIHGVAQVVVIMIALGLISETLPGGFDTGYTVLLIAVVVSIISLADYARAAFAKP